ncbi:MAG TPA: TIM barrel protein [Verrucomicrobiae bacterium]|jgi:hydroxypyruvate isomerase|nr:TIM barrel protein [Verrucomicrobiae bacterium]
MNTSLTRRAACGRLGGLAAWTGILSTLEHRLAAADETAGSALKGRIHHSVCKWCYDKVPLEDLCRAGKGMGLSSVELLEVKDFDTLQKHGLMCAMVSGVPGGITSGLNRLENHDKIVAFFEDVAPKVASAGAKNIICFSGNRKGMSDQEGLENCAIGLKRIMPICEKNRVLAVMELLNSKIDHKDYMCDHTPWGLELCKRVGSEHFKLLYDIYHMQIMEGDVIRTIRGDKSRGIEAAAPYIAHYHTGGVPGRAEIDDTQELNYAAIMKAILETGFQGHVAQEFIPRRPDVLASLRQGVHICDV